MANTLLVCLFLFIMVFHKYEGAKTGKDPRFLVQAAGNHRNKQHKLLPETVKHSSISRAKPHAPLKNQHEQHKMQPTILKEKSKHFTRLDGLKKSDLKGSFLDMLCQIISFINKFLNLHLLCDLCKSSNQTTSARSSTITNTLGSTPTSGQTSNPQQTAIIEQSSTNINTLRTTQQQNATREQIISFYDETAVYLTCQHVPGTIQIIDATFGSVDPSCTPTSVASYMMKYAINKTSLLLKISGGYFQNMCGDFIGTLFINGTYTCIPSTTPGTSMKIDASEGTEFFIQCPAGTIVVDSAMFGSFDGVLCPPTSVMGNPAFNAKTNGLTSFSLLVSTGTTFNDLCSGAGINKLSVTYRCQTTSTSASTFKSVALFASNLNMVCPQGEINVTSIIFRSRSDSSCFIDKTDVIRSLLPSQTTEVYITNSYFLKDCSYSSAEMTATYSCVGTVSQFTLVVEDFAQMVLKCPYGQRIHLVTSKYYCAINSSEKVYTDPAGLVKKCDGKAGICYFNVNLWTVLDMSYDPRMIYPKPSSYVLAFSNCPYNPNATEPAVLLSITYTCTG